MHEPKTPYLCRRGGNEQQEPLLQRAVLGGEGMRRWYWVDDIIIPFIQMILGVIGIVIVYVCIVALITFGVIAGAYVASEVFCLDLFAWIGVIS